MRAFDLNFTRAGRKAARPRDKIPSGERLLRGDEILNDGGILSGLALNVGKILSGSGILNETSRGRTRHGFTRRVLRELCVEASPLRLRRKFQSASGSQTDYKFKRATAPQTDRKFKMAVSLRVACKFKTSIQKFYRGYCASVELLRQKSSSKIVLLDCLKFQNRPYALARLKFGGTMSKMSAGSPSAPLKFQSAMVAEFARSKFRGSPRAAQCRKIRAQGQGG